MSRLEVDADVEVVLAQAALAGRLTWGQVEATLWPGPDLEAQAARSFDAYRALGGVDPEVGHAYFRGRHLDYQQAEPDDDTSGWPADVRRRWATEALERSPERSPDGSAAIPEDALR